ncbi:hypothetical protein MLD38_033407 [Melastoma candidum]|uniref:Uncharacterized protein n=1 Tax=Melastoma candidum TaxID=119954 RepID=A0ACB9M6N2_9MYRT|nr:hypothetical protein MLD38_033407 [Melastoma candidum]
MNWIRGRSIGRGSTASVSLATCPSSGETFAVKSAPATRSEPLQNEVRVLSSLDSPHIVGYSGCGVTQETDGPVFNLFLEYVPAGSLSEVIRKRGGLEEAAIARYAQQILVGIDYLHSRGIVHCDVKPSNILIGRGDCVKVADFGCSKSVGMAPVAIGGTPMYMAPEAACGAEQGCPADIWAFGCTIVEMATGKFPWTGVHDPVSAIHKIVYSGELPEIRGCLSAHGRDFLGKCLRRNPKERWTAGQLLDHPFLDRVNSGIDSKQAEELSLSPTSVMDQEFWDSAEVTGQATMRLTNTIEPSRDRIGTLCSSMELLPSWSKDDGWMDVRGGDADVMMAECGCSGSVLRSYAATTVRQEPADMLAGVVGGLKSSGLVSGCNVLCFGRDTRDSIQEHQFFL